MSEVRWKEEGVKLEMDSMEVLLVEKMAVAKEEREGAAG